MGEPLFATPSLIDSRPSSVHSDLSASVFTAPRSQQQQPRTDKQRLFGHMHSGSNGSVSLHSVSAMSSGSPRIEHSAQQQQQGPGAIGSRSPFGNTGNFDPASIYSKCEPAGMPGATHTAENHNGSGFSDRIGGTSNNRQQHSTSPVQVHSPWGSTKPPSTHSLGPGTIGLGFASSNSERPCVVTDDSQKSSSAGTSALPSSYFPAMPAQQGQHSAYQLALLQAAQQQGGMQAHRSASGAVSPRPDPGGDPSMLLPSSAAHPGPFSFSFSSPSDRAPSPAYSAQQTATDGTSATSRSVTSPPPSFGYDSQHSATSVHSLPADAWQQQPPSQHQRGAAKDPNVAAAAAFGRPPGYASYYTGKGSSPPQPGHSVGPGSPSSPTHDDVLDGGTQQRAARERFFSSDGREQGQHWRTSLDGGNRHLTPPSLADHYQSGQQMSADMAQQHLQHHAALAAAAAAAAGLSSSSSGPPQVAGPTSSSATSGGASLHEFSIFVGDLAPNLREEDLVAQFLRPPMWPPAHPFAIAHAQAQQARGIFTPAKIGPAPFTSTKSAKIMTDPVTGVSRGFGFVRFSSESDSLRALVEMQGVYVAPLDGQSGGRPLRVCPATPKNKSPAGGQGYEAELAARTGGGYHGAGGARGFAPGQPGAGFGGAHPRPDPYISAGAVGSGDAPNPASALGGLPQALQLLHAHASRSRESSAQGIALTARAGDPYNPLSAVSPASAAALTSSALDPNNTTVFVGGLSSLISEDTLRTFFVPFGEISYVKIPPGKGCGFVQFVRKIDAERAIERMQGFPIGGGRIRLSWGRSQGDKAAAAAVQAAAQAAQLGHLASLAGLGGLSASQLAQLAGLSNALSAVQGSSNLNLNGSAGGNNSGASGNGSGLPPGLLAHSTELDANSTLLQQIAAARAGLAVQQPLQSPSLHGDLDQAGFRGVPQPHQPQHQQQQPLSNNPREAELLRQMYAGMAQQQQPQQQPQHPNRLQQHTQQQHQQPHPQQHHASQHSLPFQQQQQHPPHHHHQQHLAQHADRNAEQLASSFSNMDLRQRSEDPRTFYQSGSAVDAQVRDGISGGNTVHHSDSPSPNAASWYARGGAPDEVQHRASPHSMLKASTFAPFSPADSPVVGEAPLPPEHGGAGGAHNNSNNSNNNTSSSSNHANNNNNNKSPLATSSF